jgi:toxin-antitoxin system PIN domain toxin
MPDVSVLVYAHRAESPDHARYAAWVTALASSPEPFALSELVLHGFIRVVTNGRIFDPPSTTAEAFQFIDELIACTTCSVIRAGPRHWSIFRRLCAAGTVRGKLTADAVHAAVAIESGCEWVSADTDFARFAPPLRWLHL